MQFVGKIHIGVRQGHLCCGQLQLHCTCYFQSYRYVVTLLCKLPCLCGIQVRAKRAQRSLRLGGIQRLHLYNLDGHAGEQSSTARCAERCDIAQTCLELIEGHLELLCMVDSPICSSVHIQYIVVLWKLHVCSCVACNSAFCHNVRALLKHADHVCLCRC